MNNKTHIDVLGSFARLDTCRNERTGIPEAVFSEGKTSQQVVDILRLLADRTGQALATRVQPEHRESIKQELSGYTILDNTTARTIVVRRKDYDPPSTGACIAVLAAGTADLPIAEEARVTAEMMGCVVFHFYDVGVAGIHRLVEPLQTIIEKEVSAVVVVAGMEGALPTVVRGLVPVPVIGVPTSVGYGYGGKGEAALMTMLQSCAPGLTVVNVDNGFGAGATAALIANMVAKKANATR